MWKDPYTRWNTCPLSLNTLKLKIAKTFVKQITSIKFVFDTRQQNERSNHIIDTKNLIRKWEEGFVSCNPSLYMLTQWRKAHAQKDVISTYFGEMITLVNILAKLAHFPPDYSLMSSLFSWFCKRPCSFIPSPCGVNAAWIITVQWFF